MCGRATSASVAGMQAPQAATHREVVCKDLNLLPDLAKVRAFDQVVDLRCMDTASVTQLLQDVAESQVGKPSFRAHARIPWCT